MSTEEEIKNALEKYRTVAVVGLSDDSSKASYMVAKFLKSGGWSIIPVNPFVDVLLGLRRVSGATSYCAWGESSVSTALGSRNPR